ncbi:MAG: thioredoxin family protein [Limnohabitans sp.]|jgi:thioredoxin 1|uniref:thioredoxin family protein n=1 Tax=Limnohabitans sp. TaxID=1907725 RepID=UPI002631498C|nr:thioredoxin family protein [Limnohabitans sp.]
MLPHPTTLTVYCLCAAWCRTCDAYLEVFEALNKVWHGKVEWAWVDIEDSADLLDDVDVESFPCLLVTGDKDVYFFGPVLPQASVATQLVERALVGKIAPMENAILEALNQRFIAANLRQNLVK